MVEAKDFSDDSCSPYLGLQEECDLTNPPIRDG